MDYFLNLYKKINVYILKENGQGLMEYGLILLLISIISIIALTPLGDKILFLFKNVATAVLKAMI
ncbi:MAG: Flp family type IVb pilin [Acholeplasmataceae bacterium]|nr:Flp family type IVb pilin [Acholeplasmataceae bacterium]